jgi:hypothetical protein
MTRPEGMKNVYRLPRPRTSFSVVSTLQLSLAHLVVRSSLRTWGTQTHEILDYPSGIQFASPPAYCNHTLNSKAQRDNCDRFLA